MLPGGGVNITDFRGSPYCPQRPESPRTQGTYNGDPQSSTHLASPPISFSSFFQKITPQGLPNAPTLTSNPRMAARARVAEGAKVLDCRRCNWYLCDKCKDPPAKQTYTDMITKKYRTTRA